MRRILAAAATVAVALVAVPAAALSPEPPTQPATARVTAPAFTG